LRTGSQWQSRAVLMVGGVRLAAPMMSLWRMSGVVVVFGWWLSSWWEERVEWS
jgi:hypothetical protein